MHYAHDQRAVTETHKQIGDARASISSVSSSASSFYKHTTHSFGIQKDQQHAIAYYSFARQCFEDAKSGQIVKSVYKYQEICVDKVIKIQTAQLLVLECDITTSTLTFLVKLHLYSLTAQMNGTCTSEACLDDTNHDYTMYMRISDAYDAHIESSEGGDIRAYWI
ncbi:hypothetical protein ACJX0J_019751 [Zea mays]